MADYMNGYGWGDAPSQQGQQPQPNNRPNMPSGPAVTPQSQGQGVPHSKHPSNQGQSVNPQGQQQSRSNTQQSNPNIPQGEPNQQRGNPNIQQGNPNQQRGNPNQQRGNPNQQRGNPNGQQGVPNQQKGQQPNQSSQGGPQNSQNHNGQQPQWNTQQKQNNPYNVQGGAQQVGVHHKSGYGNNNQQPQQSYPQNYPQGVDNFNQGQYPQNYNQGQYPDQYNQGQYPDQYNQGQYPQQYDDYGNLIPYDESQGYGEPPKKKSGKKILIIFIVILVLGTLGAGGVFAIKYINSQKEVIEVNYEGSGKTALDSLMYALASYDATNVDSVVGVTTGDSYIAQEWSYANGNSFKEQFITVATGVVTFEYPTETAMTVGGEAATDSDGNILYNVSVMNSGEAVTVTIPDYETLAATMLEDEEYILKLFISSGYSSSDYTWEDEMTDLMLQYILDRGSLPTKQVSMVITTSGGVVVDDSLLDDALFSSTDFHNMCDTFAQICLGWTGYETETYTVEELATNPEYAEWWKAYDLLVEAGDTDSYSIVYQTDGNGDILYDSDEEPIVQSRVIYLEAEVSDEEEDSDDEDSDDESSGVTEWVEPEEGIMTAVVKEREVEIEWVPESVIPYNWCGAYYLQNVYDGENSTVVEVGDGTKTATAGIGTEIVTVVQCTDGTYADVRVSVIGYWTGQDAITYAEGISTKNKGLTTDSVLTFIVYEVKIENLMSDTIIFNSEMTLCDDNANLASRTGTFYGFTETVSLAPGETVIINDWASSTELDQKYVCWGKTFNREYSMVYFQILAGTGDIPSYSAYEQFTGSSVIDDEDVAESSTEVSTDVSTDATETSIGTTDTTITTTEESLE